jgi:hypothetical protein
MRRFLALSTWLPFVVACGEEGTTTDCPPMPEYDVRDDAAAEEVDVEGWRDDAIRAGCTNRVGPPDAGAEGDGGAGGSD